MDQSRRRFIKGMLAAGAILLISGAGAVKHFVTKKVLHGFKPIKYPGYLNDLSDDTIKKQSPYQG
jgi:hypothetical protein